MCLHIGLQNTSDYPCKHGVLVWSSRRRKRPQLDQCRSDNIRHCRSRFVVQVGSGLGSLFQNAMMFSPDVEQVHLIWFWCEGMASCRHVQIAEKRSLENVFKHWFFKSIVSCGRTFAGLQASRPFQTNNVASHQNKISNPRYLPALSR